MDGLSSVLRPGSIVAVAACLLAGMSPAVAQNVDPNYFEGFSRTRPILRAASDVPTALVRSVRFSEAAGAGATLYVGGDDKVVRRYTVVDPGAGDVKLEFGGTTPWPIYRAIRGAIYALDVARINGRDRIAIGGIGTKISQVELMHVDRPDLAQLLLHPQVSARNAVYTMAFNPNQRQLAIGHDTKPYVLVWDLDADKALDGRLWDTKLESVYHVAYNPSGTRLAAAGYRKVTNQVQGKEVIQYRWEVQTWDTASARQVGEGRATQGEIFGLCWKDDSTWLATSKRGGIESTQGTLAAIGGVRSIVPLPKLQGFVVSLFDSASNTTRISFWNGQPQLVDYIEESVFVGDEVCLHVSPLGNYIAAGGLARLPSSATPLNAVRVWRAATGKVAARLPDEKSSRLVGSAIANVGIIRGELNDEGKEKPYQIGFAWGVTNGQLLPAYQQQFRRFGRALTPVAPDQNLGARLQERTFQKKSDGTYLVAANGDAWGPLPVWGGRFPKCYAENKKLLAIGYSDGILVCNLAGVIARQQDDAILRSFYGHDAQVTCLDFSPDGNLLISGSLDGTICGWRLTEILNLRRRNELEIEVQTRQDQLGNIELDVLKNPPVGSLGAECGFRQGQVITGIEVAGLAKKNAEMAAYLRAPIPAKELRVFVVQTGIKSTLYSVVTHDPLWTLYPAQDSNWVVWTPEGNFDAPIEGIDRLEWHFDLNNDAARERPKAHEGSMVFRGRDFKDLYYQPSLIDDVLRNGTPDRPRDAVIPPSLQLSLNGGQITLTATPNGREPITEMEVWLNSRRLIKVDAQALKKQANVVKTISTVYSGELMRLDGNQLVAVAAIDAPGEAADQTVKVYNRKRQRLDGGTPGAQIYRRLHYLGVGVTELKSGVGLQSLRFAGHDAIELGDALKALTENTGSKGPGLGYLETLAKHENQKPPTEANIRAAFERLLTKVKPNDFVVVLLSGHGVTTPRGFRFVAEDTAKPETGTISDQLVNDYLAQLPCRCLLLLDTCHAEGVQLKQKLQDWPGFGLGPQILASCDSEQESFEHPDMNLSGGLKGHGLFTAALLEALKPGQRCESRIDGKLPLSDGNGNGLLTVDEWCLYAKQRTEMLSDLNYPFVPAGKKQQIPKVLPSFSFQDSKDFPLMSLR